MAKAGSHIKQLFVFADWIELAGPKLMGTLQAEQVRGKEVFSFSYDKEWLRSAPALLLDPDLGLAYDNPPQHISHEFMLFRNFKFRPLLRQLAGSFGCHVFLGTAIQNCCAFVGRLEQEVDL